MAIGREDTVFDEALMERFCERDLVYTDSLVLETPIAFPIKSELGEHQSLAHFPDSNHFYAIVH
jgi:hypothetical protein